MLELRQFKVIFSRYGQCCASGRRVIFFFVSLFSTEFQVLFFLFYCIILFCKQINARIILRQCKPVCFSNIEYFSQPKISSLLYKTLLHPF